MTQRTVVLDLGNVLISWDPRLLYRRLLPAEEVEEFLDEVGFAGWNAQQDAGRSWAAALEEHAARHPHRRELLSAYPQRFAETLGGEVPGTQELLAELHAAGHRLVGLTNWSAELYPVAEQRYPWLGGLHTVVVSGRERLAKPAPAFFRLALARLDLDAASTVYVDDLAPNVEGARSVGLVGLRFTSAARLRADLTALGLLPPPATPSGPAPPPRLGRTVDPPHHQRER